MGPAFLVWRLSAFLIEWGADLHSSSGETAAPIAFVADERTAGVSEGRRGRSAGSARTESAVDANVAIKDSRASI